MYNSVHSTVYYLYSCTHTKYIYITTEILVMKQNAVTSQNLIRSNTTRVAVYQMQVPLA